jgi:ubiquinone/menaquinone biosynthesis C-methylase UbiE
MGKYLESCRSEFWQEVFRKETEYLLTALKDCKNILSVGCGPAIIERELQENGFNVVGLDVSKEALKGAPDSIRTAVGSAEEMKFDNANFDAVIYVASLQFIDNYKQAIQETARVLKPNGKLIAILLNPMSEFFEMKRRQADSYINKIKHPYLAPIKKAIQKQFSLIKTEYYLGIRNEQIFESQDPKSAVLYVIQGIKS